MISEEAGKKPDYSSIQGYFRMRGGFQANRCMGPGKDYPVTGNPDVDTTALKQIDAHKVEITRKKAGKVVSTATREVSKDGKTLMVTEKGEKVINTLVYEKQ